jgi:MFS family permease
VDREALAVVPEAAPRANPAEPLHRTGAFRAMRSPMFRRYFIGQTASASGTFVQQTAIGWLVLQVTGSASSLGLVLAVGGLPSLLFGPWGGTLADRVDNRRLLLVTQTLFGLLAAALWISAAAGRASVPLIVAINVAGGVVSIVDSPARQAFVSALVPPEDLASAISLNGVVMNSARVVGPALAGALIVTVGTTPCFAVNAISYGVVIVALLTIKPNAGARKTLVGRSGIRDALHHVGQHEQLRLPLVMMAGVGLLSFNFAVVLPLLARETFHGNGGTYGLLSTMLSVGSVAGSLGVGLIRHPRRVYLLAAVLAFGVCLALTALAPNVPLECGALLLAGLTGFTFVTMASTTLQLHADPAFRGRVMALWVFVYIGTTPLGSVLTGWLSATAGPRSALWLGAAACALAAVPAARVRTPPDPDAYLRAPRAPAG